MTEVQQCSEKFLEDLAFDIRSAIESNVCSREERVCLNNYIDQDQCSYGLDVLLDRGTPDLDKQYPEDKKLFSRLSYGEQLDAVLPHFIRVEF